MKLCISRKIVLNFVTLKPQLNAALIIIIKTDSAITVFHKMDRKLKTEFLKLNLHD